MIRSLRARLTAWYLALFSLLFVAFSVFLYGLLASGLRERVDNGLRTDTDTAAGMFEDELDEAKGDVQTAASETAKGMRVHDALVAVVADGVLLAATDPLQLRGTGGLAALVAHPPPDGETGELPQFGACGARAVVRRELVGARQVLVVTLAPLDAIKAELRVTRRVIFVALPLLLGIAGLGGYLLTKRGLAPLAVMAVQAREIGGSSLDRRLRIGSAAEELEALAASFNELLARLDQSFGTMRRFVADASHELRTPLSVIRGEADVALAQDRTAASYRESLAIVLDEARRLSRLVDDLLNLARADSGRVKLQTQDFYLDDLLAECCRSAQAIAGPRGVEVECLCAEDAPFRGDEELLHRLVMNLLDNAIRYTPSGGKITAALEAGDADFRITVTDTGIGIAPEAAPHVFERFYRADQARSRKDGGFGLGLSIVKWVAEAHRGGVQLASQPGVGTAFTVTLPRQS
ncbi:MAG TPA: ATP-binding protein [Bryobacteraceae bacterium]|nr:ATP-binding protein [Bryobacteraceae bacterium]